MKNVLMPNVGMILVGMFMVFAPGQSSQVVSRGVLVEDLKLQIVTLDQLSEEMIGGFFKGEMPEMVLECSQGTFLPLSLKVGGEFLIIEPVNSVPYKITVLKTCYLKCEEEMVYFSTDLESWKGFEEFFTGKIGVVIHEKGAQVELSAELHQRSEAEISNKK